MKFFVFKSIFYCPTWTNATKKTNVKKTSRNKKIATVFKSIFYCLTWTNTTKRIAVCDGFLKTHRKTLRWFLKNRRSFLFYDIFLKPTLIIVTIFTNRRKKLA